MKSGGRWTILAAAIAVAIAVAAAVGLHFPRRPAGPAVAAYYREKAPHSGRVAEVGFLDAEGRITRRVAVPDGWTDIRGCAFSPRRGRFYAWDDHKLGVLEGLRWRTVLSMAQRMTTSGVSPAGWVLYGVGQTLPTQSPYIWDGHTSRPVADGDLRMLLGSTPWSPDGKMFAAIDIRSRRLVITRILAPGQTQEVGSLPLLLCGGVCWTPGGDVCYVVETKRGQVLKRLSPATWHASTVPVVRAQLEVLAVSPQGTQVACLSKAASDRVDALTLEVLDLETGRRIFSFRSNDLVERVVWAQPGVLFASTLHVGVGKSARERHDILGVSLNSGRVRRVLSGDVTLAEEIRP